MGKQKKESLVLTNYAILEDGKWYAVISFTVGNRRVGNDEVLRSHPFDTPEGAMALGQQYIEAAHR